MGILGWRVTKRVKKIGFCFVSPQASKIKEWDPYFTFNTLSSETIKSWPAIGELYTISYNEENHFFLFKKENNP